jgi:hypothetical protein
VAAYLAVEHSGQRRGSSKHPASLGRLGAMDTLRALAAKRKKPSNAGLHFRT